MTRYEFQVKKVCEENSAMQLAEMVIGYREIYDSIRQDNDALRKENETLRYLIAKHKIEKMGE